MKMMSKLVLSGLLGCALSVGFVASDAAAAEFSNKIKVEQGTVEGSYDDAHRVVEWYGIPYAAPAVGESRWRAPREAEGFKGVKDCTVYAPVNVQYTAKEVVGQEGVLTLDIVRPDTTEKKLPVLVFIHGGNNQVSNSRMLMGQKLAAEANIVYVSVQYRLGLLGFNNLPALNRGTGIEEGGNFALLDQAAALDWVKENIQRFGGDADNITVSGFSAGGRDVMAMLISPVFKDKFNKAISFSGGMTVADAANSRKVIAEKLAPLAVSDGKASDVITAKNWLLSEKDKDKDAVRNYLQNVKAERFAPVMAGAGIRMSAFPHLYGDDKVLPKDGFATESFNSVPLLLLTSSDEFSSFVARDQYFRDRLDYLGSDAKLTREYRFANKYGSKLYGFFNGQQAAEKLYKHYDEDIYVCSFAFGHGNEAVGEDYAMKNGAFHGVFLPFISDQEYKFTQGTDGFESVGAKALSKAFISSLSAFMRTGNPNSNLLGNTWSKWNPEYRPELVFDANRYGSRIYSVNSRVSYTGILHEMANDKLVTDESKDYIIKNVLNGRWFSGQLDEEYGNPSLWAE